MRQRDTRSGRVLFLVGLCLNFAILALIFLMFRSPVVSEHEEIRGRMLSRARRSNYEWAPIEAVVMDEVKHNDASLVLTMYRVVIHLLLTRCVLDDVQRLLQSVISSDYSMRMFSVDIHIVMRCPTALAPHEIKERRHITDIITSLRWTEGRVTGEEGPPVADVGAYIKNHWLPVTNWELSVFIQEGYVVSSDWFSSLRVGMEHYAVKKSHQILPRTARAPAEELHWRLPYTIDSLTPKHLLGFSLCLSTSQVGSIPKLYFSTFDFSNCPVLFPAKWQEIKASLVQREEIESTNTTTVSREAAHLATLMESQHLFLIYLSDLYREAPPIYRVADESDVQTKAKRSDVELPSIRSLELLDASLRVVEAVKPFHDEE